MQVWPRIALCLLAASLARVETDEVGHGLEAAGTQNHQRTDTVASNSTLTDKRQKASNSVRSHIAPFLSNQEMVDYIGDHLKVHFSSVNNLEKFDNLYVRVNLTLSNQGTQPIPSQNWKLYIYSLYGLREGTVSSCNLTVTHENGALFSIAPVHKSFTGIAGNKSIICQLLNKHWIVTRTDNFPNWYVTSPGARSKVVDSTVGEGLEWVGNFDTPNKWKRSVEDRYNPLSLEERFENNRLSEARKPLEGPVVTPTPRSMTVRHGEEISFDRKDWSVFQTGDFVEEVKFLAGHQNLTIISTRPPRRYIQFVKAATRFVGLEAYSLDIDAHLETITITALNTTGAFYGVQSLVSLLESSDEKVSGLKIDDMPRFPYRGLMMDIARNFRSVSTILQMIDTLSSYKINRLHIHLSDNEAWRLQIPGLPELTDIGSRRCQDEYPDACLLPALGSGPDDTSYGTGFYNVTEYREILRFATSRHVTIVPEIDMPGHSRAAIQAMAVREERLSTGQHSYLLSDGSSADNRILKWRENSINPCLNTSYVFVEKIVDAIISLHKDIQPLKYFHLGGDEVPAGVWDNSTVCRNMFPDVPKEQLTAYLKEVFVKKVRDIVASRDLTDMTWEDGLLNSQGEPFPHNASRESLAVVWDNHWSQGNGKRAYELANAGNKVVLAMSTHLYFDHPYEPDPEERGLYWAVRFVDTGRAFSFNPTDVYANIDVNRMGEPLTRKQICQLHECPDLQEKDNVIGIQACMWSETMRTDEEFYYMGFPRILALAERAWHQATWEVQSDVNQRNKLRDEDWARFADTLSRKELRRLEKRGVLYRVPPPGAVEYHLSRNGRSNIYGQWSVLEACCGHGAWSCGQLKHLAQDKIASTE